MRGVNNIHLSNYCRSLMKRRQYQIEIVPLYQSIGVFFCLFSVQYHMLQPNKLLLRCNPSKLPSSSIRSEIFLQIWKIRTFQIVRPYVVVTHSLPILFVVRPKLIFPILLNFQVKFGISSGCLIQGDNLCMWLTFICIDSNQIETEFLWLAIDCLIIGIKLIKSIIMWETVSGFW